MIAVLTQVSLFKLTLWLLIGGSALYFGSEFLVSGAINLAKMFKVSETVISVSVIAIGTSVPELAASLIAVAKKEKAISMGNLIGSNIFNIGAVVGSYGHDNADTRNRWQRPCKCQSHLDASSMRLAVASNAPLATNACLSTRSKGYGFVRWHIIIFMYLTFTTP